MAVVIALGAVDHQHRTDGGDVLPCDLPYVRCQGQLSDVFVIVIEDPADWQDWQ